MQKAKFGDLYVPPHIVTEIAEIKAELKRLRGQHL
jgi:hypothetical protein